MAASPPRSPARSPIVARKHIRKLIAEGHLIVIWEQKVLRLDAWVQRHPGGKLPILHMVGKDATDQINIYHSAETLKTMSRYSIGIITEPWIDMEPPISTEIPKETDSLEKVYKLSDKGVFTRTTTNGMPTTHPATGKKMNDASTSAFNHFTDVAEQDDIDRAKREYPSLDAATQRGITLKFRKLHAKIREQGLYDCNYWNYGYDFCRYLLFFGLFYYAYTNKYYILSSIFLGCFWQQIMFVAHDAGHLGITHNVVADTLIGIVVADLCCGLSIGWWKSSHNVHHLVPNHPKHDPDIQNVPLFATSPTFFTSIRSSYYDFVFPWDAACAFLVPFQKYTYYPIMFVARFNLYFLSWCHLLFSLPTFKTRKLQSTPKSTFWILYTELTCMAIYWYFHVSVVFAIPWWSTRVAFVMISHGISLLLHVQITISHFGMSTADLGPAESFPQKQLRTTMDVDCPPWLDWVHGGLQFQAVHHLFPRLPKHNYRQAQGLVKQFCKETGIKYTIFGFVEGNKVVLGRLGEIAKQVGMLRKCQEHMVEECFE